MASLAHYNMSQFLTFKNKIALKQNKIILLLCDLRLIIIGMFATSLVKATLFYTELHKRCILVADKKMESFFPKILCLATEIII
jgi:hypothetical protein